MRLQRFRESFIEFFRENKFYIIPIGVVALITGTVMIMSFGPDLKFLSGGEEPTPTPTPTEAPTPTPEEEEEDDEEEEESEPTVRKFPTATPTKKPSATSTPTAAPTNTPTPTSGPTATPTPITLTPTVAAVTPSEDPEPSAP